MADEKKPIKPGMPPLPPGILKPNLPPMGGKPSLPPAPPAFGGLPSAGMPQAPFAPQFQQPQPPAAPARDAAAEEAKRLEEEKDRLEKKINDMEKLLSQEKEKALMATLKSQQDEALSSRVESSLKDIQEKMRRDRRDHEVEEERLTLRSKIKELETRLAQERETWMTTLKNQMAERETQGRDVEGHFIYRLQEMERRWLDEKAQWQKEISQREEQIRQLRGADEKLRELQDEFRKVSLEKSMVERDINKMKDEVARAEREKASIESYIKIIPEKERELAEMKADNIQLRAREAAALGEVKLRDEKTNFEIDKLQKEIGRLQAEIGSLSDRKNSEKNEELRQLQNRFEAELQEKDKQLADVSGEKVRALSELMKIKGFISRVQAINAVLEKERGQMKLEKMQLAQNMAAQLEEIKRLQAQGDAVKAAHQAELEEQARSLRAEIDRVKNGYAAEMARKHSEETAELVRNHQEEIARINAARQAELAAAAAAARDAADKTVAERQAEMDAKLSQLRGFYENSAEEARSALRRQLDAEYTAQIKELRVALTAAQEAALKNELENRRLAAISGDFSAAAAAKEKEIQARMTRAETEAARLAAEVSAAAAQKAEAEKYARAIEAERQRMVAETAALREQYSVLAAQKNTAEGELARAAENLKAAEASLKAESENRTRFESEMLFLKQKVQQMELQAQETGAAFEAEQAARASLQASADAQAAEAAAQAAALNAELERYKGMEKSLADRLKWALKGKSGK